MIDRNQIRIGIILDNDGQAEQFILRRTHGDTIAWELAAANKGWPLTDAPTLSLTWIAHHILRRERPDTTPANFAQFTTRVIEVFPALDDGTRLTAEDMTEEEVTDEEDPSLAGLG